MQTKPQHELKVLTVLCAGTFLFFNSYGSINVTLPTIQAEFHQSLSGVQWISTIGLVMSSSLALGLGRIGDIVGRTLLYKGGVLLYALGAALSAAAQSFAELVAFRIVMTLGLSMAMPLASAILVSEANAERRGAMLGLLLSSGSIGRAIGPAVGGTFLALSGWRAVFLANAMIGTIVTLAVWSVLGASERKRESLNLKSALAFVGGYPALLIGISLGADHGWGSSVATLFLWVGASGLIVFVLFEAQSPRPLIAPSLWRNRRVIASLAALLLFSVAYFPILVLSPLYLQNVLFLRPLNLGLLLTTLPVAAAVCAPLSGRLVDRFDPWRVTVSGLVLGACGEGVYAALDAGSGRAEVLLALGLVGVGIGLVLPANQKSLFGATPTAHYGVLGGMLAVCGPGAGALGIGITVALVEGMAAGTALRSPEVFVAAQQSAVVLLVPLPLIAAALVFVADRGRGTRWGAHGGGRPNGRDPAAGL